MISLNISLPNGLKLETSLELIVCSYVVMTSNDDRHLLVQLNENSQAQQVLAMSVRNKP